MRGSSVAVTFVAANVSQISCDHSRCVFSACAVGLKTPTAFATITLATTCFSTTPFST
eukprot:CAMPEP_0171876618 /NCGR_PEP_ID=MMETSP0992-20121227/36218_1 /TAXON_ID=483369 /ORGANISM="non described non described, Strain CCMP2098" /LENGTH=57 /DNA_ID=CAMNT_0012501731 /DNA_START=13 /DNA_END=182 /DNA_ORIENTATION=+